MSLLRCFITLISVKVLSVIQKRGSSFVKKALFLSVATLLGTWCSQGVLKVNEGQKCFFHLKLNDLSIKIINRRERIKHTTGRPHLDYVFYKAGAFIPPFFLWAVKHFCPWEKHSSSPDLQKKKGENSSAHIRQRAHFLATAAANMFCKGGIRYSIPSRLTHLNSAEPFTANSCISGLAEQSALCISQNIHIWKLAELNEHPALTDDPIVAQENLHNRHCPQIKFASIKTYLPPRVLAKIVIICLLYAFVFFRNYRAVFFFPLLWKCFL